MRFCFTSLSRPNKNTYFSKFAWKSSFLSKGNQIVDYKCFRKSSFVFLVFQGRTKTNDHFSKFVSKSSFLSKVNQIVDCQCFRKSTVVFAVFHGRTTAYMFQHISESLLTAWMVGLTRYFLPDGPGHVTPPRPTSPLLVTDARHHTKKTLSIYI